MGLFKKIFSTSRPAPQQGGIFFTEIQDMLGFAPLEIKHYERAFTHRSSNKLDDKGHPVNYERLEFLGDAMLGSVVAAHLFNEVPNGDEGYLTKMRSKIVSREHLNELGRDLNLIKWVESKVSAQHFGENIHGNLFEAFVGAIYLDRGFEYCERFIHNKVIGPYVDIAKLEGKVISYKSLVIEWCQKQKKQFNYEVYEDNGKEGQKHFAIKLTIDGRVIARARATSKKKAEEKASQRAFFAFQEKINKN